jgi:hypothetical protein
MCWKSKFTEQIWKRGIREPEERPADEEILARLYVEKVTQKYDIKRKLRTVVVVNYLSHYNCGQDHNC